MNKEIRELVTIFEDAVYSVYKEESFLLNYAELDLEGLEQAFVFRTGIYFSDLLKGTKYQDLDLDSEYNKSLGDKKATKSHPNGIRPDLLLHIRGTNDANMLVAEFKGWWLKDRENDIAKLQDLTSPEDIYQYQIGVLVEIGKEAPNFRYFINGSEYE